MSKQTLALTRLQKQQRNLDQEPLPNFFVTRKGLLNFHFCIYGLEKPYENGFYHGVLQLDKNYPFEPPNLLFFTPNGRFQTNKSICTSFTNFHKQTWTAGWNVRTMLIATVSFMTSEQIGTGYLNNSYFTRSSYAQKSLKWNLKNQQFRQLFENKLLKHPQTKNQVMEALNKRSKQLQQKLKTQSTPSPALYILFLIAFAFILFYSLSKADQIQINNDM